MSMNFPKKLMRMLPVAVATLALLAGCATGPFGGGSEAQRGLDEGIALYDQGDFAAAITKLNVIAESTSASVSVRTTAYKYMAFGYCVTNRPTQCRAQFDKALSLNPKFDLEPSEKGHPLWGPVFERAKKAH
jgi:hypothetical protein